MSDDELARHYHDGDDTTQTAVLREAARRDRRAAQSDRDRERWAQATAEWHDFAHAQYLAAEEQCRGNLLNRDGIAAGISPWSLWSGSASRVTRYASEELKNFWETNQRLTVSQFAWYINRPRQHAREDLS